MKGWQIFFSAYSKTYNVLFSVYFSLQNKIMNCAPKCQGVHIVSSVLVRGSENTSYRVAPDISRQWFCQREQWWHHRGSLSVLHLSQPFYSRRLPGVSPSFSLFQIVKVMDSLLTRPCFYPNWYTLGWT